MPPGPPQQEVAARARAFLSSFLRSAGVYQSGLIVDIRQLLDHLTG